MFLVGRESVSLGICQNKIFIMFMMFLLWTYGKQFVLMVELVLEWK
jgi:hypothetical protein